MYAYDLVRLWLVQMLWLWTIFPPSLCSIGARHFGDEKLSRPSSGQKLAPIEKQSASDSDIKVISRRLVVTFTDPTCLHFLEPGLGMHFSSSLVWASLLIYVSCNFVFMFPPSLIPRPKEDLGMRLAPTQLSTTCSTEVFRLVVRNPLVHARPFLVLLHALWTPGSTSYEVKVCKALIEQIRTELWF